MGIAFVKYHRLGGLSNSKLLLTILEPGKSKIRVPPNLIPGDDSLWIADSHLLPVCSCGAERKGSGLFLCLYGHQH